MTNTFRFWTKHSRSIYNRGVAKEFRHLWREVFVDLLILAVGIRLDELVVPDADEGHDIES